MNYSSIGHVIATSVCFIVTTKELWTELSKVYSSPCVLSLLQNLNYLQKFAALYNYFTEEHDGTKDLIFIVVAENF